MLGLYAPLWRIAAIPHAAPFPEQRICIKNSQLQNQPKDKQIEN
jgi:hypothetical protein